MTSPDLIGMSDIARLAGESRATVGNWKRRYPDFPEERERTARGPLYDLAEVQAWLSSRRDAGETSADNLTWKLRDIVRTAGVRDGLPVVLAICAARKVGGDAWASFVHSTVEEKGEQLLLALPQLALPERDRLNALVRGIPPQILSDIAHLVEAYQPGSRLEREISTLMDMFMQLSHMHGEFATPALVIDLIVGLAAPRGVVYDPCTGTGRLLAQATHAAESKHDFDRAVGQEINIEQVLIARLYFMIIDVDVDLELGDVFRYDAHSGLAADCIIADLPLGMRLPPDALKEDDPRWLYCDPSRSDATGAWIQHIVYHLAARGRAVVLVPNSALFEGARGRVLQRIVKAGLLDAVISLPAGTLTSTAIPTALLVLRRDRPNGATLGTPGPVLMVDVQPDHRDDKRAPSLTVPIVRAVITQYETWSAKGEPRAGQPAAVVSYATLAANEFHLHPRRYTALPIPQVTTADLEKDRVALQIELEELIEACRVVDASLTASLQGDRS
jgi:N-6 DNA Methylase